MALTVDEKQIKCTKNRLNTLFLILLIKFPTISIFTKIVIVEYYLRYKAKKKNLLQIPSFLIYGFTLNTHCCNSGFSIIKLNNHSRNCSIS